MGELVNSLVNLWSNGGIAFIIQAFLAYVAILWIAIIIWVTKDINNRTRNILFQSICILLVIVLTPLFGLIIYLIIRPVKTLAERYYEEAELDILNKEEDIIKNDECFSCHNLVHADYLYCPYCKTLLKKECPGCQKHFLSTHSSCPYCGADYVRPEKKRRTKKEPAV